LLLALGVGFFLAATLTSQDVTKEDAARLEGVWAIVSVEIDGQALPMDNLEGARLSIRGTRYDFRLEQTRLDLTFKLDSRKSPKAIDLKVMDGPEKGQVYHGIFKVEDGLYTICRSTAPGKDRPTEFATRPKSGLMMVVWRQVLCQVPEPKE
jgi:uncharacterized protein (TIGR03067 family)